MEEWKDIEGYEGYYQVSNYGRVKSLKRNYLGHDIVHQEIILKPWLASRGYFYVNLSGTHHCIHRLVSKAFISNLDNKPQVNHINGVKTDNRPENLEWCNASDNLIHAYKIGSRPQIGEKHHFSKLNSFQVRVILRCFGLPTDYLSGIFNVSISTIIRIRARKTWKHI